MDKKSVLAQYAKAKIFSQSDLYDYMLHNSGAEVDGMVYNFSRSNEAMEFMARFLECLDFKVIRLFLQKKGDDGLCEWMVAFNSGIKWYYFEPYLEGVVGEHVFERYDDLTKFIMTKVPESLEGMSDDDLYEGYILKEIPMLLTLDYASNLKISKAGEEILFESNLEDKSYTVIEKEKEKSDLGSFKRRKPKNRSIYFVVGFVVTLGILLFILWYLSTKYS